MNAIVPLNVTAIRVNNNDANLIVSGFKGRTALFEQLPYSSDSTVASTGDTIFQSLEDTSGPANPLGQGVHIHWELPDYFRRGVQKASTSQPGGSGPVIFPHAPNRWLVVRYLSQADATGTKWNPAVARRFLIESDYVNTARWDPNRPGASVPLPIHPQTDQKPYKYMGRVLDYGQWNPAGEKPEDFLPYYQGVTGQSLYLTSIGFVGPGFAAFYPECCSVFGMWDTFADEPTIANAIANNLPIQFRVSYQVIGWIDTPADDPLHGLGAVVTKQYNDYVAQQTGLGLKVEQTPSDFFISAAHAIAASWTFNKQDIPFTLNGDGTIATLSVPEGTLCAGMMQEVVWNMLQNPGATYFLNNPDAPGGGVSGTWTDTVELAIGNTTAEALSALLKRDMANTAVNDPDVLKDYEYLLNALQLGLLRTLEQEDNKLILLDEALHTQAFASLAAGQLWSVEDESQEASDDEVTLPLDLAEKLALLNQAQKAYDQARAAIDTMTRQLFMDWIRYVKMYVPNTDESYLTWAKIQSFLDSPQGGALQAIVDATKAAGLITYTLDDTGRIVGMDKPPAANDLANALYNQLQAFITALKPCPGFRVLCTTAPTFNLPTEPVLMVEGNRIEPVRRNGATGKVLVRLSNELLTALTVSYSGASFSIPTSSLAGVPAVTAPTPMKDDVQALVAEAFLLTMSLAGVCADALKAQGGANNPAVVDYNGFVASLQAAQGGASPLENPSSAGLYAAIRADKYKPAANPSQSVTQPLLLSVTFTNATGSGWAPDAVGWMAQSHPPGFPAGRVDPFLPMYVIWSVRLRPLSWGSVGPGQLNYTADNLVRYFELTSDAVDYRYLMSGGLPVDFTIPAPSSYSSATLLSKKPVVSLTSQIDRYLDDYPNDPADPLLIKVRDKYNGRRIMAQTMSGLNVQQTLRDYIPQITVEDLPLGDQDQVTLDIQGAATGTDNWYTWAFNSLQPIARHQPGSVNFGPLRAGFLQVMELTIVDVFGQIMQLSTAVINPDTSLQTIVSYNMQPDAGDTVNANWIYLAPRLLAPSRVWFRWLSAEHNDQVAGISSDFVEMNGHPATSPVCGWVLPNHLDASLFFYSQAGAPIGSFGIEAGTLRYRTRAGNRNNPRDLLYLDIGQPGHPLVNPHLAAFMWWVNDTGTKAPAFLRDLMAAILRSDTFINPANYAQAPALAVLIGRPLAITRTVLSIETPGGLLPLSQADDQVQSPFPQDVLNNRVRYADRQTTSSANLGAVRLPVRLGDLVNMDDGLVGYLIEQAGANPYGTFYSPAATAAGGHGVVHPVPTTLEVTLNADPVTLTLLVDPRAGVHATAGVLPVEELSIPGDQYSKAMSSLAMTFFSNPVLRGSDEFVIPLPKESGYDWSWIDPAGQTPTPLQPNQATEFAHYGYSPQNVLEGWLELSPTPDKIEKG